MTFARIASTLASGWIAALLCQALHVPLPWLLGPLLATGLAGIAGLPVQASDRLRNLGQMVIGLALGLYFTPAVVALILRLAPAIGGGVAWALLLGWGFYRVLRRFNPDVDAPTAWFSAAIGGASEMAVLAKRHGGRVDLVAAAHSLRVLIVVTTIPFGFQFAGVHGLDTLPPAVAEVHPAGLAALLAASGAAIALLRWRGLPNPFVLGALAATLVFTAAGIELSALPKWAPSAAQLFIGVALGTRFTPQFVHAAPRWLAAVAAGTLGLMGLSAGFAWALSHAVGLHPATLLLATSPGGIAEMAITAKVLQLGVPVVTAFQVVRYVAVLTLTGPLFNRLGRETGRAG